MAIVSFLLNVKIEEVHVRLIKFKYNVKLQILVLIGGALVRSHFSGHFGGSPFYSDILLPTVLRKRLVFLRLK